MGKVFSIKVIIILSVLLMPLLSHAGVAEDVSSHQTVGIPDNGIGGPVTLEDVQRIMLEVNTQQLDSVMSSPDRNYTDLHRAAEACDLTQERAAINKFSVSVRNDEVNRLDREGYTPLAYAARAGCLKVVAYLIERGAVVDLAEEHGLWTPLLHAAEEQHADVVAYLLDHGAKVNVKAVTGETPLIAATRGPIFQYGPKGDKDTTIEILLKHGAKNEP